MVICVYPNSRYTHSALHNPPNKRDARYSVAKISHFSISPVKEIPFAENGYLENDK